MLHDQLNVDVEKQTPDYIPTPDSAQPAVLPYLTCNHDAIVSAVMIALYAICVIGVVFVMFVVPFLAIGHPSHHHNHSS